MIKPLICLSILIFLFPLICFSQGIEEATSFIHTPQALAHWLSFDFKYQWELSDTWQTAQETLSSRKGDCEDFALLASAVLTRLGISNHILLIKFANLKLTHAICIWQTKDGWEFISNQELFSTKEKKLEASLEKFYPDWESLIFTNEKKQYVRIIKRT